MIAVSYLKSKYPKKDTIKLIDESIADFIHVDLMDGIYVDNNNFTIDEVLQDLKNTSKELDVHLMVENPENYVKELATLNVWMITFHLNGSKNPLEMINLVKSYGIKVGIAINPFEDVHILDEFLPLIDYVLVMSVVPGKGGQKFMMEVLSKITYLKNYKVLIGIDGGINSETIFYLKDYAIDNIISGSFVCMSDNYNKAIESLKKNVDN